jgi:transcriptional regulator with XRE-family HTH domain
MRKFVKNVTIWKGGGSMYPNVKAEIARKGITLEVIAKALGITLTTLSLKMNGKYQFTLKEAKKIKNVLGVDIPLEVLFEEAS